MLGIFGNTPFCKRTPPRPQACAADLVWWQQLLSAPIPPHRLINPFDISDAYAFWDASTSVGIGICIGSKWRAWKLRSDWKRKHRDICWAEAVGFELLAIALLTNSTDSHLIMYGDNQGVVEGWWNKHSNNPEVNLVFRRVHKLLSRTQSTVYTRYVASAENPADDPSRGVFPHISLLLPPVLIPAELQDVILDYSHAELLAGSSSKPI
ncbi:hypothetical protein EUX98_g9407 [Antrodiella citrinella]|uniref:RNase H type-1 domain-containing protein n=1 Tax=Antrodiella citrinella TaxID=2447956 RepID=A0A4S4LZB8_9APHY|nr:hypothetical protein EUX98_g9407 [Antrodiella citrinella]